MEYKYFDNAATTKPYQEVLDAVINELKEDWANPNSLHTPGITARNKIENARNIIANILCVKPSEIIFTSSASESNATAINAFDRCFASIYNHHDILENTKFQLVDQDYVYDYKPKRKMSDIFSYALVTPETGEIFDLKRLIELAHEKGARVLVDATQALGNIVIKPHDIDADYMSFGIHKVHGPRIGILYVKEGAPLKPIIFGSQENHRRGSTENTAYIVGAAIAVTKAVNEMKFKNEHCAKLRKLFVGRLKFSGLDMIVNEGTMNIPSVINVAFKGIVGESLMLQLDSMGYCVSTGSACNSGNQEVSKVLKEMKVSDDYINGAIRVSIGLDTTEEDIDNLAKAIVEIIKGN